MDDRAGNAHSMSPKEDRMRSPGTLRGGRRAALTAAMAVLALLLVAGCDKGGSYGAGATNAAPAAATSAPATLAPAATPAAATQQATPAAATQQPAGATPKATQPGDYGY